MGQCCAGWTVSASLPFAKLLGNLHAETKKHDARYLKNLDRVNRCVMSIIGWIILGLIAGFIASKIVNKQGEGFFLDIILGIVGAIVGGVIFSALGASGITGFNLYSMVVAVIGAVVVLVIYHAVFGRRAY
jgi:uncharacterized membrane protein YeaQ/YmgE (transglycosylase-associated protein family)